MWLFRIGLHQSGVSQGSILSFYINVIARYIRSNVHLFADDIHVRISYHIRETYDIEKLSRLAVILLATLDPSKGLKNPSLIYVYKCKMFKHMQSNKKQNEICLNYQ